MESVSKRLEYYLKSKNINALNAANILGYSSSEKISRLFRNGSAKPSCDILEDIANKFEDLNMHWLLTGKGNMHVDSVKQGLMNDVNLTQEIMNLNKHLTKTQQELIDAMKEIEKLRREKDLPDNVSVAKLNPGQS